MLEMISTCNLSEAGGVTAVCATDKLIAIGDSQGHVYVVNPNGQLMMTIADQEGAVWSLSILEHGLVSGGDDYLVRIHDAESGNHLNTLKGHNAPVTALATSLSRGLVLSGDYDGFIMTWDLSSGSQRRPLSGHGDKITNIAVRGSTCVTTSYDTTVRVWDLKASECIHILIGHARSVFPLLIDGGRAMTGSLDGTIRVWDIDKGLCLAVLEGHERPVNNLRLHKNTLISCGVDGYVRVWSLSTFEQLRAIKLHGKAAVALEVLNGTVVSGGKEGGTPDNACGLDSRVVAWTPDPDVSENIVQLGTVATLVYRLRRSSDRLIVVAYKRGMPAVEIWK